MTTTEGCMCAVLINIDEPHIAKPCKLAIPGDQLMIEHFLCVYPCPVSCRCSH